MAAAGGVARDNGGNWIRGFSSKIGNVDVLRAELWGIRRGIKMALDMGLHQSHMGNGLSVGHTSICQSVITTTETII